MLPDHYEYIIQRARQKDLMREVAKHRLARYVTQSQHPTRVRGASRELVCRLPVLRTALCQTS
jgi:hypothetical protein